MITAATNTDAMNTAPMNTAARETYDIGDTLPAKGSRVWVTGFTREEHDEATRLLDIAGFLPTAFATGADAVLVPDPPPAAIIEDSERAGRKVLVPGMLRGGLLYVMGMPRIAKSRLIKCCRWVSFTSAAI
jgi:hypothetical protein